METPRMTAPVRTAYKMRTIFISSSLAIRLVSVYPSRQQLFILATDLVIKARPFLAVLPIIAVRAHQEHIALEVVDIAETKHRQIGGGKVRFAAASLDAAKRDARRQQFGIARLRFGRAR